MLERCLVVVHPIIRSRLEDSVDSVVLQKTIQTREDFERFQFTGNRQLEFIGGHIPVCQQPSRSDFQRIAIRSNCSIVMIIFEQFLAILTREGSQNVGQDKEDKNKTQE